ncbi:hypothetical protein GF324_11515 [bacterium]|nr:hypothetical protein [bacterium]
MDESLNYLYDARPDEDPHFSRVLDTMIDAFLQGNNGTGMALLANLLDLYPEKINQIGEELLGYQIRLRMTSKIVENLQQPELPDTDLNSVINMAKKAIDESE